jgi:RNA polymerase sigma-70 factor (ECF subfamily)
MGSETTCPTSAAAALGGDASLVRSALAGDRAAFEALVDRHQRSALATCLAVLRDRQLAEDAVQDAFVSAYRSLRTLRDPAGFGGWLLSIARNRATRLARDRTRRLRLAQDSVERADAPRPQPLAEAAVDDALLAALAALPDHERSVVTLRYFDGHGVAEIAAITGRPTGTVTKQLQRAHERLRATLKERP